MYLKTLLTIEDLYQIATFMSDNGYNEVPLEITIPVYTRERLLRLNREFNANKSMKPTDENDSVDVDEINVVVLGVRFKYKLSELPQTERKIFDNVEENINEDNK